VDRLRKRIPQRLRGRRIRDLRPKPILKVISPADILTLMNFLCGVFAIMNSVDGGDGIRRAMFLIALGVIFDGMDGPVARKFGSSHRFGVWLDSLADAVTFCIAPAILIYNMFKTSGDIFSSMQNFLVISSSVAVALLGILRLARFSFYAHKWKDFIGLPTPAMALFILCFSSSYYWMVELELDLGFLSEQAHVILPIIFLATSFAMLADMRYRKGRKKVMVMQGLLILLFLVSLIVGLYYPDVALSASLMFSGVALLYLISPLSNGPRRIWGASKWADLVEEDAPPMNNEEIEDIMEDEGYDM
jgi:CDP-diacylglycerol--serine O-phosphatidyltransferase